MPQWTIAMLRLDLQGFLWRALLNETLPKLESKHLCIRAAREDQARKTELFDDLNDLCNYVRLEDGAAVVNLRFSSQLERYGTSLLTLVENGATLFVHSRDSELLGRGIGRELASRARAYEASPVAAGKVPSEKQQAWLDLLAKLGIARPPCMLAILVHNFMGKISSLELALHSMEHPDGSRLVLELRKSMGGRDEDVKEFFQELQNAYNNLDQQLELRLKTAEIHREDREKVEFWRDGTSDLMDKIGYLAEGDGQAGSGIENDLRALRQALNIAGSVRL